MPLPPRPTGAPFPVGFLSGGSRLSTKEGLEQVLRELEERVEAIAVGGGVAGVATFNGRGGAVLPTAGDYDAADITNTSGVAGSSVEAALDALAALIPGPAPVSSVHGRTGAVVGGTGDYSASQVTNDSGVAGAAVSNALDALSSAILARVQIGGQLGGTAASPDVRGIRESGGTLLTFGAIADGEFLARSGSTVIGAAGGGGGVSTVFGRSGIVTAQPSDYDAVQVDFTPDGDITSSNAQAAIVEVRDDAAAALVAHTGASNPHSGSLGTAHEGAGGAVHANASGATAGFMSAADKTKLDGVATGADVSPVDSVHGRTGAVVAATSDYDAAQVDFAPDGDIAASTVQAAIVEVRNDTDTKLGAKVEIGGQIGGTISSPDVRGIRESGATLLTFGAIADGETLIRSGTSVIGGAGGGGAVDSVHGRTGAVAAATSDYDAVQVDFTPDGDIAASNVQAAVVEVRDDAAAALTAHTGASNPHSGSLGTAHEGAGGAVHPNAIASSTAGFMSGADKAKLDGVAASAAAVGAGIVGVGASTSDGVSGTAARVDHVHAHGTQAGGTTHPDAIASTTSGFMSGADKAKLDGVASGATATPLSSTTPTTTTRATAVVGVATTAARSDHKHDIEIGTPVAVGTANAAGSGTAVALANHVHSHGDQTTATHHATATTGANGFMSAADKTKLDGITPAAAAVGAGIVGVGSSNSDGASGTAARVDHVHAHGTQAGGTTHPDAIASSTAGFMSGADKAKLDGVEALADVTDAANVAAAGAVMDSDFAGSNAGELRRTGAGSYSVLQDNLTATTAPTSANDNTQGYGVGSKWVDTVTEQVYFCANPGTGAAVWRQVGAGGGGGSTFSDSAFRVQDNADATKQVALEVSGIATGTTRTLTVPDRDIDLGNLILLGGQIGGTAASPDIRGLRESGATLLTMGAVADGELLSRSGTNIIGVAPSGGGASIGEITGLSTSRYYSFGSDPTQVTQFSVCLVTRARLDPSVGDARYAMGSHDGTGGWGIRWTGFGGFADARPIIMSSIFADSAGTITDITFTDGFNAGKLLVWVFIFDGNEFGNTRVTAYINGGEYGSYFAGGVTGAPTAGGNLSIGCTDDGGTAEGLGNGFIHGAAYVTRVITQDEISDLSDATLEALELQDIPGGGGSWTAGYRVNGAEPGATWTPFVGSGTLTRTGTAATYAERDNPPIY